MLNRKYYYPIVIILIIAVALLFSDILVITSHNKNSPIPSAIAKSVNFPIYYPKQSKLPLGFNLDVASFSTSNHIIVYKVTYGDNSELAFSLQAEPSTSQINYFYSKYMPIHTTLLTPIGTATIGGINTGEISTLTSIPTNNNTWILINATSKISQTQLQQVIAAMVKN